MDERGARQNRYQVIRKTTVSDQEDEILTTFAEAENVPMWFSLPGASAQPRWPDQTVPPNILTAEWF